MMSSGATFSCIYDPDYKGDESKLHPWSFMDTSYITTTGLPNRTCFSDVAWKCALGIPEPSFLTWQLAVFAA